MPKLLFVVVLLICYGISVNVRYQQLETWRTNPQQFFVGEKPLMTTLDALFFCVEPRSIGMESISVMTTSVPIHLEPSGLESNKLKSLLVKMGHKQSPYLLLSV